MKLEDQVCSIELSKKLKELGVEQDSYFSWVLSKTTGDVFLSPTHLLLNRFYEILGSAFTVAELGEMLPKHITKYIKAYSVHYYLIIVYNTYGQVWTVKYERGCGGILEYFSDTKEVDARAKMMIYLRRANNDHRRELSTRTSTRDT